MARYGTPITRNSDSRTVSAGETDQSVDSMASTASPTHGHVASAPTTEARSRTTMCATMSTKIGATGATSGAGGA